MILTPMYVPCHVQIAQEILKKVLDEVDWDVKIAESCCPMKVCICISNNSWVLYYDLSMILCLGGCYISVFISVFLKKWLWNLKFIYSWKSWKLIFFHKLLFSAYSKKLKIDFFDIMIILKNLSKYMRSDFLPKKAQSSAHLSQVESFWWTRNNL